MSQALKHPLEFRLCPGGDGELLNSFKEGSKMIQLTVKKIIVAQSSE